MKRVAVFGNAGGGKSTLSRRLAEVTGLPLHVLDVIQFPDGRYRPAEKDGGKISPEEYSKLHRDILGRDRWIIDGYGSVTSAWERFAAADTLIYIDLPLRSHYWGVTKRFSGGLFRNPPGWPDDSPVLESTLDSLRVVWLCHRHLTPKYRRLVSDLAASKRIHHLKTRSAMNDLVLAVRNEQERCGARSKPSE
jgi:adenylate kinase family enzyme